MVCDHVEILGLIVETTQFSPTVSLAETLDNAAHCGLLYTVIITNRLEFTWLRMCFQKTRKIFVYFFFKFY